MPGRALSPALSESGGLDITDALVATNDLNDDVPRKARNDKKRSAKTAFDDTGENSSDEQFIASLQAAANRKASNGKSSGLKKGGGFQAMGLTGGLLKAIAHKGYSVPTPIQRKTMPLVLTGQDVVGMARTGSGKTAAFVLPMIERLKRHQPQFGARALVMSPSRELALQTLKVVKELGKNTDLRCTLIVGGDRLEDQFHSMKDGFPDIVVATPGRFLHIKVEMDLDLSSYEYVVFDEADRLFEMGFATQLNEILHALPPTRQTLLFSATLPTSLIEFANAGLQEPRLIRLDSESKVSPDLQNGFFSVRNDEKEAALLHVLQNVIRMPTGETEAATTTNGGKPDRKRKRSETLPRATESPTQHSTIVFASTKHTVEYLAQLLRTWGFVVSYAYGSLDQTARKIQVQNFRAGMSHILVVTDVAARGIDIPVLANVINYDFPPQPKNFVHRVGRTARAGQKGWSYSLVKEAERPYLLDLQLFLGKQLVLGRAKGADINYTSDVVIGGLPRPEITGFDEWVKKQLHDDMDIAALRHVATNGEKNYNKTKPSASAESARRAKKINHDDAWNILHPLFDDDTTETEKAREVLLAQMRNPKSKQTIFEVGDRGVQSDAVKAIKKVRYNVEAKRSKENFAQDSHDGTIKQLSNEQSDVAEEAETTGDSPGWEDEDEVMDTSSVSSMEVTIIDPSSKSAKKSTADATLTSDDYYMSYTPRGTNINETRGYSVNADSTSFITAARSAAMNLANDEATGLNLASKPSLLKWDKRHKKYVAQTPQGESKADGKTIRSESGAKIPASFRSGRFETWKKANRVGRLPRVGEEEKARSGSAASSSHFGQGQRFKHTQNKAPKEADRYRDDYEVRKKRVAEAKEKRTGRFSDGPGKTEVKDLQGLQRDRLLKAQRREKTGRHRGSAVTRGRGGSRGGARGGARGGSQGGMRGSSRGGRGNRGGRR